MSGDVAMEKAGPFEPGDMCGPYEILNEHDRGGMAIIYAAIDPAGEHRAIKVLQTAKSLTAEQQVRFRKEIGVLGGISDNNVVRFYEAGLQRRIVWLALELLQGDNLATLIHRQAGRIPLDTVLNWAIQIANGLHAIHALGVVHRDLKPENVIIENDVAKILDLGIAQLDGLTTTTSGAPPATLAYMSPEQAAAEKLDARSDLFNLGLILYELITGRHALGLGGDERITRGDVFAHVMKCEISPLQEGICDPALAAIVHKALERDRDRRFSSAAEMGEALMAVLHSKREERWAKAVDQSAWPVPQLPAIRKQKSGETRRRQGHLRLVASSPSSPVHQPERARYNMTAPMKPERLQPAPAHSMRDTIPLPELARGPERGVVAQPGAAAERELPTIRQRRPQRPRIAVSRTLFMQFQRKSIRERRIMMGLIVVALLAIPVAWLLGRHAPAQDASQAPLANEPVVVPARERAPSSPAAAVPIPVRVEPSMSAEELSDNVEEPSGNAGPSSHAGPSRVSRSPRRTGGITTTRLPTPAVPSEAQGPVAPKPSSLPVRHHAPPPPHTGHGDHGF